MSESALKLLGEGLKTNTKLTDFFFTDNNLKYVEKEGDDPSIEAGLEFLKSFSNKKDLLSLAFNSCNLNGELLEELQNSIKEHQKLKELYLFANKIESDGAGCIAAMIKNKNNLTCFGVSNNKLMDTGATEIAEYGLNGKTKMVKLSIENNRI
jgi:Leucine-rich repeat (LRR) protein